MVEVKAVAGLAETYRADMVTPQQPPAPTSPFTPACPVCGAPTVQVYDRNERRLFACAQCETDVIVPLTAWALASRRNREKADS